MPVLTKSIAPTEFASASDRRISADATNAWEERLPRAFLGQRETIGQTLVDVFTTKNLGIGFSLRGGDQPEIMLGVLGIAFRRDEIVVPVSVTRQLKILFHNVSRCSPNSHIRSIRLVNPGQGIVRLAPTIRRSIVFPVTLIGVHFVLKVSAHMRGASVRVVNAPGRRTARRKSPQQPGQQRDWGRPAVGRQASISQPGSLTVAMPSRTISPVCFVLIVVIVATCFGSNAVIVVTSVMVSSMNTGA